jgi:hypothetical protein
MPLTFDAYLFGASGLWEILKSLLSELQAVTLAVAAFRR